jgi:hypothetical protein
VAMRAAKSRGYVGLRTSERLGARGGREGIHYLVQMNGLVVVDNEAGNLGAIPNMLGRGELSREGERSLAVEPGARFRQITVPSVQWCSSKRR